MSPSAQDLEIAAVVRRERRQLLAFILKRVRDAAEAEDVLQEALYELVAAYRLMQPIEQAGAWLMRVARNRIIDRFRKRRPELLGDIALEDEEAGSALERLLPAVEEGPDTALIRELLLEELERAVAQLPAEQREVFVAQELEGASFKELSARWGVGINTLLSRKRYAVLRLRERLRAVYEEWLRDSWDVILSRGENRERPSLGSLRLEGTGVCRVRHHRPGGTQLDRDAAVERLAANLVRGAAAAVSAGGRSAGLEPRPLRRVARASWSVGAPPLARALGESYARGA